MAREKLLPARTPAMFPVKPAPQKGRLIKKDALFESAMEGAFATFLTETDGLAPCLQHLSI